MFYFSEPHDGSSGALKALPKAVKAVIDGLDSKCMSLAAAMTLIGDVKPEGMRVTSHFNADKTGGLIMLKEGDFRKGEHPNHVWLLIKFSENQNDDSDSK